MLKYYLFLFLAAFSFVFANPKVVLFNDTSAWYHWGCTGNSTALKEGINQAGFELTSFPINATSALKEVPPFEAFDNKENFNRFCEANPTVIDSIRQTDAVIINGEGTIHDTRPSPRALLYLAHISKKFFGKHVEIINHSAYPKDLPSLSSSFHNGWKSNSKSTPEEWKRAQEVYTSVYSELDFVAIREPVSFNTMQNLGISATMSFDCLPLYIRDHYQTPKTISEKTLVLAGSVAYTEGGAENLCRYLDKMSKEGFKVKVLTGAAAFPSKDDSAFIAFLQNHSKTSWELVDATSMQQWLDTINNATLFVSGRFHHSIAAFCLNTPFIALNSNTQKIDAICDVLGQPAPLSFSDPELSDKLYARTQDILTSPAVNNQTKIEELHKLAEKNFDGLKSKKDFPHF